MVVNELQQKVISLAVSDGGINVSSTSIQSTDRRTEYTRRWRRTVWRAFWRLYAVLTYDLREFIDDYCEAWKLSPEIDREFILFTDNGARLVIPCSSSMDDKALLQHVRVFYNLSRAQGGLFEFLGTKSSLRVDIVTVRAPVKCKFVHMLNHPFLQLVRSHAVGTRVGLPLALGRYGPFSRLVHYFKDPSELAGRTEIMDRLVRKGVLTAPSQQTHGLNIVRSWDPYITSTIVIIPVLFSFFLSIVWALVSTIYYKADINTSTQTGFTIGSYVVTAGALLIALVAFLDSKYVANDGVSSINLSKDESSQLCPSSSSSLDRLYSQTSSQHLSPQPQPTPAGTSAGTPTPISTQAPVSTSLPTDPNGETV
ncbi:uncharacterized protein yc1106_00163 [Curvularia clavata]|uniref:Transmembrane protein n=1 Tax=Curvularia clavata TaxID=95742 RepID=A0A9Q8Z171_CURCL|nr:uncharacterized protein yc1106_00163 [Curvularia clavata]